MTLFYQYLDSPLGLLEIKATDEGISHIQFIEKDKKASNEQKSVHTEACIEQLESYFAGKLNDFTLTISPKGTFFQQAVWKHLQEISFGKTLSYLQLSRNIGNEKAIRAVGTANGANPLAIVVPCHRVIGSDGSLTGYAGGLWRKEWLLRHEGSLPTQNQLNLF